MDDIRRECLFCRIADKEIPSTLLYDDEDMVAFRDISPVAPVHILIVPKKHIASMEEVTEEDIYLVGKVALVAQQLAKQEGIAESGYRVVNNCGADGGQAVPHLHFHLIGGAFLGPFTDVEGLFTTV